MLQHDPACRPIYLLPKQGPPLIEYFPKNLSLQADAQPSTRICSCCSCVWFPTSICSNSEPISIWNAWSLNHQFQRRIAGEAEVHGAVGGGEARKACPAPERGCVSEQGESLIALKRRRDIANSLATWWCAACVQERAWPDLCVVSFSQELLLLIWWCNWTCYLLVTLTGECC